MPRKTLQSPSHIKKYLCQLALKVEKGSIDAQAAGRIAYILSVALKATEVAELEERLTEIENLLLKKKG